MRRRTSAAVTLAFTASVLTAPAASAATDSSGGPASSPRCDVKPVQAALKALSGVGASGISVTVRSPRCGVRKSGVGLADLRTGRKAMGNEHSRIASNTKTWTATVVLQLVGEGKLRLDDTVEDHLPGLIRTKDYDGRKITIRQLLQHTSGLPDYLEAPFWEDDEEHRWDHIEPLLTVEQALRLPPPDDRTRDGFSYSNTNYNLAGLIVTEVTGRSIGTEIERRIIKRLGLRETYWPGDRVTLRKPDLRGYVERNGTLVDKTEWNTSAADASGALVSSGADVTAFWTALMSGKLLAPAQLAEMKRTIPDDSAGSRYGLGVERYEPGPGLVAWGHSGYMETGHKLRNAVTDDGERAVTLLIGSESFDEEKVDAVVSRLIRDLR
ncbi:serine hydrolase domain-containing protein [Streptomyces flavofungini]|uniref:serine hydrolase domain-containing protein n=1 Tax=Streptomyces flavofungini TaxID=68200 RepID=UPI0025B24AFD|nr:serine hydrolase domain-containing protein [Streptomyces flavofungini]WJV50883.1 serine hydrolase domain-containing protein [Streptomyces flavofungini]